jgi:hypothetical protein
MSMAAGPHRTWLFDMNRQRRVMMRVCCLVHAVPQLAAALVLCLLTGVIANAQQIAGVPGSPDATVTLNGKQLPPPPMRFGGVIRESYKDSKPWWPPRVVPPKGAPNILLIMTGDQGYGVPGTFGGVIPTPALDRIAKAGLRYTEFNSTALCSPTRAALITGRNHHSVGFGVITRFQRVTRATTRSSVRRTPPSAGSSRITVMPRRGSARTVA